MTEYSSQKTATAIATSNNQLNKLRAAVLGGNDGIVSTAGLVLGVAGASSSKETILIAGVAGLVSGAISMAAGEFVSVSSQRDSEKAFLARMRAHIAGKHQSSEVEELVERYKEKGMTAATATKAAEELEKAGTITVELEKEYGIDPDDLSSPWAAAIASALSFTAGAAIPLLAITFASDDWRLPITVLAVLLSLILTGTLSARAGQANKTRAALRVVVWGVGAMAITYAIGHLIGAQIG